MCQLTFNQNQRGTLVLDPMWDEWQCHFKTADIDEFLTSFWASRGCDVFIDEAGDAIGQYDRVMRKTATRGRQWGHNCFFITQDAKTLSPIVRSQCTYLYLFAMHRERAKDLAIEWNCDELLEAAELPKGQCIMKEKGGAVRRFNVFQ